MDNPTVEIGTVFKTRGKESRTCVVVDIHKTYNAAGELVKTRYVCSHEFMGQTVVEYDVTGTGILMGKVGKAPI